jgi:hypothetical protein
MALLLPTWMHENSPPSQSTVELLPQWSTRCSAGLKEEWEIQMALRFERLEVDTAGCFNLHCCAPLRYGGAQGSVGPLRP